MNKALILKKMLNEKDIVRVVGAHDGLTARLVEKNGFDAVWASSFEVSASHGVPDASILSMAEFLHQAIDMNSATKIPVIVDADTGYGNSLNVIQMVRRFEAAGIAAVCIEDKKFPKQNSLLEDGKQELASVGEFVGKIMAAKNTQSSEDFMVFARVEALIAGWGQEEALKRGRAYVNAGADAILIHSKSADPGEIIDFVNAWDMDAPLILVPTTYKLTLEQMKELKKVRIAIFANHGLRSSIKAVNETLKKLNDTGDLKSIEDKIVPLSEVFELQGMPLLKENEKRFVKSENEDVKAVILGAGAPKGTSLQEICKEIPQVMLDINGKSLLQRNIEILTSLNIKDINVVVGYLADKVNIAEINKIVNPQYREKHILHSIFSAEGVLNSRTLLIYGDILFDRYLTEKLLNAKGDIVLAVDGNYKTTNIRNKKLDMVQAEFDTTGGVRKLEVKRDNPVKKIGKKLSEEEANFEFIGLAKFSEKGIKDFKDTFAAAKEKYAGGRFQEAESFDMAHFYDLIQEMIENGYHVNALEVSGGWTEVHGFEDYKRACSMFRNTD
ncbi:isocitrate lyase/phosphoenolpyruvate mutase family protein [Elusimicrobiota bacterium]